MILKSIGFIFLFAVFFLGGYSIERERVRIAIELMKIQ
tara:strand:+ start:2122 stop:2235 length:114 start_codon:yes stop_codon:yes gene_type:complete